MPDKNLWKYCTTEQCKELLISLQLFGRTKWTDEKQIACLYALSNHAKEHYTSILIPKRDGRMRRLLAPEPLLKSVQSNILHHVLDTIPVSPYAMAYCKGTSVVANATAHVGQKQILKLDIEDFFDSIVFPMVYQNAFPHLYFPPSIRTLLTNLCCYKDYLPQGAPTSAAISNLVMKPFDEYMGQWCIERGIVYTRYCDDMVFSGEFDAFMVKNKVQSFLEVMGFNLNRKKTKLLTQHHRQTVTGLVVNAKTQVSIPYRKALRKEIYYCQKYGVVSHLMKIGDTEYLPFAEDGIRRYLSVLLGKIHFILHANPDDHYFQTAKCSIKKQLSP